MSKIDNTV